MAGTPSIEAGATNTGLPVNIPGQFPYVWEERPTDRFCLFQLAKTV